MPETILDFSSTHILGKIVKREAEGFFESQVWSDFLKAHQRAFGEEGYKNQLAALQSQLSDLTKEQFGRKVTVEFKFDTPEATSFVKMGKTHVDDGIANTELSEKGNGLQRAVAFALIRIYADQLRNVSENDSQPCPGLFLCVDEPETWMHPKAQLQLADALSLIASKEQVWISTHSPYMLKKCHKSNIDGKLFIFNDLSSEQSATFDQRINTSQELGIINPGDPSLAEITYRAFQIPTAEYHSELFGAMQIKYNKTTLIDMDKMIRKEERKKGGEELYARLDSRYLTGKADKPITRETLPVHIRNLIDHPESIAEKEACYNKYQASLAYTENPQEGKTMLEQIMLQDNTYTAEELEKSIRLLEEIWIKPSKDDIAYTNTSES